MMKLKHILRSELLTLPHQALEKSEEAPSTHCLRMRGSQFFLGNLETSVKFTRYTNLGLSVEFSGVNDARH